MHYKLSKKKKIESVSLLIDIISRLPTTKEAIRTAITFVGAIAATLNYRWSLEEALLAMKVVKPVMLVTDKNSANWHSDFEAHSIASLRWHVLMDTDDIYSSKEQNILTTNMLEIPSARPQSFNYSSNSNGTAIVCFTSGTTGKPKGVMLSHSALVVQSLAKIAAIGYTITFVGAIAATLNYRWSLEEAVLAMKVVKPVMLVTDKNSANWHSDFQAHSIASLRWHVLMDTDDIYSSKEQNILTTNMLEIPSARPQSFNYSSNSNGTAIVCFTSGTTGKPKGVMLSHSALVVQSLAKIAAIGYSEDDVYLHTAPLGHVGGLSSALAMLMVGACHVLMPKFEAKSALEAIEKYNVTSFITVPAIMSDIISLIRTKDARKELLMVTKILNGGGSLSDKLVKDATDIFSNASLYTAYGMTEGSSSLTFMTLHDPTKQSTTYKKSTLVKQQQGVCVGKPAPHVELKISTEDSSHVGQILTRGPHLMIGYWDHIPAKENPGNEGWHETGDIGWIDDNGNLWLIGRMKGRIKSGGENIYPEEVETVILKHPGISAIAVIGLPDARLTEMVIACIQLNHNWTWVDSCSDHSAIQKEQCLSKETLQQHCRTNNLSGFKKFESRVNTFRLKYFNGGSEVMSGDDAQRVWIVEEGIIAIDVVGDVERVRLLLKMISEVVKLKQVKAQNH
uniref:2-succinylbenzoate--CoA ligase, chloroplastic/peroxisomal n=1 Tax=Tanacetum cinerariifolium TaxID=118510 RepID=A0A6L2N7U6_TANCI|nr:2-succinylbenzoate--CoA ligase, chloroplastic/peroxisomal [Tanacetum cinerariifolium]